MILSRPHTIEQIWVRWPGGREQTVPVPAGAREVTVRLADLP